MDHITFASNSATVMTTSNIYDSLNRLISVVSATNSVPVASFKYQYNSANQRIAVTNVDATYWSYAYDSLGQVTNGVKKWADNAVMPGEQFGYGFDTIGNRRLTLAGGDQSGGSLRLASYTANSLNQYTSRTVPGAVDVTGTATNAATVWVNQVLAYRTNNYFWSPASIANTASAAYQTVTTLAALTNASGSGAEYGVTNTGHIFLPQTPETFTYDLDGNLTQDGRWTYAWDAENRLTNMTSLSSGPTNSLLKLDFTYDYMGRRIQKIVSTSSGGSYTPSYTNKFVYDGWNVIAILDGGNNLLYSFTWGKDVSGSLQDAGGVGGLISMKVYNGANAGTYFYCYDGNGNVTALVNAVGGSVSAQYEYGPFGEVIRETGPLARQNYFLFSTKFFDSENGLLYYGFRYYNPNEGRWLSRDPIEEDGGVNLYGCVRNDTISFIDLLGLEWKISRNRALLADAACACGDTWDELASRIRLDTSDYQKWAHTADASPVPGKVYKIPNAVYFEFGEASIWVGVIDMWRHFAKKEADNYEKQGFDVIVSNPTSSKLIAAHLKSDGIYGLVFAGHGESDGSGTIDPSEVDYLIPNRYTSYGIAFLALHACGSADTVTPSQGWKYNKWEYNVAKRGFFVGYGGETNLFNEILNWRVTHGKNRH